LGGLKNFWENDSKIENLGSKAKNVQTRLLAACSCVVALIATVSAQEPKDLTARRVPFRAPVVGLPLTPYSLQRAMAELAWAVGIPIGYEAPADEPWQPTAPDSSIRTEGETIEQLLDAIVAREPRYLWTVDNGVIHLRPRAAVADPDNILNQGIEGFAIDGATSSEKFTSRCVQNCGRAASSDRVQDRRRSASIGSVLG